MFFIDRLGGGSRVILPSLHMKQSARHPLPFLSREALSPVCPRVGGPSTRARPGSPGLVSSRLVCEVSSESSAGQPL